MITIKLPITISGDITSYLKQYTNIVHFAYNRFQDDNSLTQTDVEWLVKYNMKNIPSMDASFIGMAVSEAKGIAQSKVVFGSKYEWNRYNKGLITKEEWSYRKLRALTFFGRIHDTKGNRKFELDIINNNQVIFKPNRKNHFICRLPNTNHRDILEKLQKLCEDRKAYFTCRIKNEFIQIIFDEELILKKEKYEFIENRILSIDLNPNYTAFTVCDYDKENKKNIIHEEIICLAKLYKTNNTDKIHHELFHVNKKIINIAKHYKCESIAVELLNITTDDKGKGTYYNKLCNNQWRRTKVIGNLKKHCRIQGIILQEIIPQYSSFIGQIQNEDKYDSIAAALEIGRRANIYVRYYIKNQQDIKVKGCINTVSNELPIDLADRWKKKLNFSGNLTTYMDLYNLIKKSGQSYRFLFSINKSENLLSLFSYKSKVTFYFLTG